MATIRGADKTICPSEVAKSVFGDNWRDQMQAVRDAAFELASENKVEITQKGIEVDLEQLKGPIRIRIIIGNNG